MNLNLVSLLAPVMFPCYESEGPEIGQQLKRELLLWCPPTQRVLLFLGGGGKSGLPIRNLKVVPLHQKADFLLSFTGVILFYLDLKSLKSLRKKQPTERSSFG